MVSNVVRMHVTRASLSLWSSPVIRRTMAGADQIHTRIRLGQQASGHHDRQYTSFHTPTPSKGTVSHPARRSVRTDNV
jgi:hypothetical protein